MFSWMNAINPLARSEQTWRKAHSQCTTICLLLEDNKEAGKNLLIRNENDVNKWRGGKVFSFRNSFHHPVVLAIVAIEHVRFDEENNKHSKRNLLGQWVCEMFLIIEKSCFAHFLHIQRIFFYPSDLIFVAQGNRPAGCTWLRFPISQNFLSVEILIYFTLIEFSVTLSRRASFSITSANQFLEQLCKLRAANPTQVNICAIKFTSTRGDIAGRTLDIHHASSSNEAIESQ